MTASIMPLRLILAALIAGSAACSGPPPDRSEQKAPEPAAAPRDYLAGFDTSPARGVIAPSSLPTLTPAAAVTRGALDSKYAIAPRGKSCVHYVPPNARIDENSDVWLDGNKVDHIPPCEYDAVPGSEWVAGATQAATTLFTALTSSFQVPSAPSAPVDQQVTFFWSGLSTAGGYLIQPVLQFNNGMSNEWEMQNYFVRNSTVLSRDQAVAVPAGHTINSLIEINYVNLGSNCQSNGANCNYAFGWQDATANGPWHGWSAAAPEPFTQADLAIMEAPTDNYRGCNDFPPGNPAAVLFWGITPYEVNPRLSGLQGLFSPDPYMPAVDMPSYEFSLPRLNDGSTFNCSFSATPLTSIFGQATNAVLLEWNSTQAPQDPR